jgi:regulation of enolase protein 1 (concanavalin A-like superfamily)
MRPIITRTLRALSQAVAFTANHQNAVLTGTGIRRNRAGSVPVTEVLEERALMSTYYVSTTGSDTNNGTSSNSPWRSISKVNSISLHAGDSVLFKGGQTFYGSLEVGPKDAGTSTAPVTFGSYDGQATINSGGANGATVLDASGIWFEDLDFTGSPSSAPQSGITFEGYTAKTYYTNDHINDCSISGYWTAGVLVETSSSSGGFQGLQITNNAVYNNVESGIQTCSGATGDTSILGLYVAYNQVYNNYGDGFSTCTGSGIELGNVTGATVEYNNAYENGSKGGNGGVGIWAYTSNDVTFQYNRSYDNVTKGDHDGDGFDFDADVSNSVMQYNYAYGNDGTGAQLDQWKNDSDFTNDIVRYNVFVNNGRENNYGNLEVWGKVLNSYLYNNVIVTTPGNSGSDSAIRVHNSAIPGLYVSGVHFVDNILDTSGGATLVNITAGEAQGAKNLTFTGNVYWTNGASTTIIDGTKVLTSLSQWQAVGQETWDGQKYGMFTNPDFAQVAGPADAPVSSIASTTSIAAEFQLASNSPVLSQRLSISSMYGISTGGKDLAGNSIASTAATVAGVVQTPSSTSTSSGSGTNTGSGNSGGSTNSGNNGDGGAVTITAEVGGSPTLKGYDLGKVARTGSNSVANGTYTITSSGSDIWGTSDATRMDETTLTGNGTIIAQVSSMGSSSAWAKAGVMIRSSNAADAQEVSMMVSPNSSAAMQTRKSTDAATSSKIVGDSGDEWVKLVRNGSAFDGYISADGVHWTLVSAATVSMTSTVEIGLAVSDHVSAGSETATFKNVSIS